jgi:HK97 family phage prohead protease
MTDVELDQRAELDALMGRVEFQTVATDMQTKLLATIDARVEREGEFTALVAAFGNVDRGKDRIMPGAFAKSLADWRASGKRLPIIWHHLAGDPSMIIGSADPAQSHETDAGLVLSGRLNIERSAAAGQIRDLLKSGDVSGWSFGYAVKRQRAAPGGVTELLELDILEAGPTPMPMNTAAHTISVKGEQVPARRPRQGADAHRDRGTPGPRGHHRSHRLIGRPARGHRRGRARRRTRGDGPRPGIPAQR